MTDDERQGRDRAADAARDTAVRTAVGMAVQIGVLVAFSLAVQHRDAVARHAVRLLKRARRRDRADELAIAEFAARICAYSHGGESR